MLTYWLDLKHPRINFHGFLESTVCKLSFAAIRVFLSYLDQKL